MISAKKDIIQDLLKRFESGDRPSNQEIDRLDLSHIGEALKAKFEEDRWEPALYVLKRKYPNSWFELLNELMDLESEVMQEEQTDKTMKLHEEIING